MAEAQEALVFGGQRRHDATSLLLHALSSVTNPAIDGVNLGGGSDRARSYCIIFASFPSSWNLSNPHKHQSGDGINSPAFS